MKAILSLVPVVWLSCIGPTAAQYVGTLKFAPEGCEKLGLCTLLYDFGYIDARGVGWQSNAGDKTDGATIPSWAKPFLGGSFDPSFIEAAVIHDHYCDRHVRTWRDTHRVLYEALVAGGVPSLKAKVMYYGVLIGGPKWISLIKGEACSVGQTCIKDVMASTQIPDATIMSGEGGDRIAVRPARYNRPDLPSELAEVEKFLEERGDSVTLEDLQQRAKQRSPGDFFLSAGDSVRYQEGASKLPVQ
jgi:hypothetical protein